MAHLPTTLLEHRLPGQPHFDWLLASNPTGPLWTVRVSWPSQRWLARGRLDLTVLPLHRRHYLDYEGSVSGNRGDVRRIDSGWHHPRLWTRERIVTLVKMNHCFAVVDMHELHHEKWLAQVTPPDKSCCSFLNSLQL